MDREWEIVTKNDVEVTQNLDIDEGWLYRTITMDDNGNVSMAMCFVPNEV